MERGRRTIKKIKYLSVAKKEKKKIIWGLVMVVRISLTFYVKVPRNTVCDYVKHATVFF